MKLPSYQELSKEQDKINNLALDKSWLVTGPPGTGKTVMALYRARMLNKQGIDRARLLMHSRLLSQYTSSAVEELGIDGVVKTFHSWFTGFFRGKYRRQPPQVEPFVYDWNEIFRIVNESPPEGDSRWHLIVDEGQDLPKEFYLVGGLVSVAMTVFADENQTLTDQHSKISEIRAYAETNGNEHQLTRNYRNTRQVADVAAHFYTGLATGIPDPPKREGERPKVVATPRLVEAVDFIVRYEKNNSNDEIGVFTPTKKLQKQLYNRLRDKTANPVQMYIGGQGAKAEPLDFGTPGIKLVNYPSAKGLEFDAVFIPELQELRDNIDGDDFRMKFYVLASRARNRLFFMYSGGDAPSVIDALPKDLVDFA